MKTEFPGAQITYVPGTQFLSLDGDPLPAAMIKAGYLAVPESGEYRIGVHANGTARYQASCRRRFGSSRTPGGSSWSAC